MIVVAGEALIDLLEALFAGERTRDAVTLSLDLNLRPSIVGDRARERQRV